jgi:hypothetical protein
MRWVLGSGFWPERSDSESSVSGLRSLIWPEPRPQTHSPESLRFARRRRSRVAFSRGAAASSTPSATFCGRLRIAHRGWGITLFCFRGGRSAGGDRGTRAPRTTGALMPRRARASTTVAMTSTPATTPLTSEASSISGLGCRDVDLGEHLHRHGRDGQSAADIGFDVRHRHDGVFATETDRIAFGTGPRSAPDAMHVVFGILG